MSPPVFGVLFLTSKVLVQNLYCPASQEDLEATATQSIGTNMQQSQSVPIPPYIP